MNLRSEDVLFVGRGTGVVSWYRTGMPSFYLGCDWVGLEGDPPNLRLATSLKRGGHTPPVLDDYKIIILQQASGRAWFHEIKRLQEKGVKVIYEVDDYLHGVRKIPSHRAKEHFSKARLKEYELCMGACNAMIVSTEWLKLRYTQFNRNCFVARNSIEGRRYSQFELPDRRGGINIGWAGGEGHLEAVSAWLPAVKEILETFEETRFISMGLPVADMLEEYIGKRAASLPFIGIENFPAALTNFDIAIAPAGRGKFYAAKSDLRWLETGALGIPLVADPFVYGDIEDGKTGFLASDPEEVYDALDVLVSDSLVRQTMSQNVRQHILGERSIETGIEQWEKIFVKVWDEC